MAQLSVFTIMLLFYFLNQVASETYNIKANSTDICTSLCPTLSQFVANSSHLLNSNITLVFNPGIHYLNDNLMLSNTDILMNSDNSAAQIVCSNLSHFIFNHSQYIHITNLEFIGCGGNRVESVSNLVVQDTIFKGQKDSANGTALELIETIAKIINCTFLSNRKGQLRYFIYRNVLVGGAIIATHSNIDISQSHFVNNTADIGGAIVAEQNSTITVNDSVFVHNTAILNGGVLCSNFSTIVIDESDFNNNTADYAEVLCSTMSSISIRKSVFSANAGRLLYSQYSNVTINTSTIHDNIDSSGIALLFFSHSIISIRKSVFSANTGGLLSSDYSTVTINTSTIHDNIDSSGIALLFFSHSIISIRKSVFSANTGGLLSSDYSTVTINTSTIHDNSEGIALLFFSNIITIDASDIHHNAATFTAILVSLNCTTMVDNSNFTTNSASIFIAIVSTIMLQSLLITNNSANGYIQSVIFLAESTLFLGYNSGNTTFSHNLGSLTAFHSVITLMGHVSFVHNKSPRATIEINRQGGAITLIQSNLFFNGTCSLKHNYANYGGAIHSIESKVYVNGHVIIENNTATRSGGGIYLLNSELNCRQNSTLMHLNNNATHRGGGLHAISSIISATSVFSYETLSYSEARLYFRNNVAKEGGGLSLESNARVIILKSPHFNIDITSGNSSTIKFSENSADYGGAVFVNDDTNSACTSDQIECFLQVISVDYIYFLGRLNGFNANFQYIETQNIYLLDNHARISGSILYGGLIDRCAVSQFAEVRRKYEQRYEDIGNAITYFVNISNARMPSSVSSRPVQVCLCTENGHDCTHPSFTKRIKKGETFTVSLVAVDQIGHPVNATIQASLNFTESGLAEGQLNRKIFAECTDLTFNVVSPHNSEELTLYASDGPCKDTELSKRTIEVQFLPCDFCRIGLLPVISKTNCTCKCHNNIQQYIEQCNISSGAFVRQPQVRAWISYVNDTGYLIYPNCPFDYCSSLNTSIDLNQPSGADAQCAFKHSSLLCGSCQQNFSLSLGSSHCLPCPNHWAALLIIISIIAILAGIAMVALLLVLNITIAVGTLNGLIFYANVVYANKSILFPFEGTNFITVFVSWLNLELGIDVCYFPGMDTYGKTWLQLTFPAYIILLVALVIIISSYSSKFSNLIGKKNPVATLATLILLSYAKLLEVCFKSLSFGNLHYPDGSVRSVWLPDATVTYLSGKHVLLFLTAILILLVGLFYTVLLFSWQWLLHFPRWRIFRWSRDQKLQTFIETYNTPYTPKYRYWTGLLLLARAILYLVAAVNVSNDPTVALTAIIFTVCCISILKGFIGSRVYRKWPVDVLETFFYLNLLIFATFTWYCLGDCRNKKAAAYTSVTTTFIILLLIILYHVYTYTTLFSKVENTKPVKMLHELFSLANDPKEKQNLPADDDDHRFHELLDIIDRPVNTNDYNVPVKRAEPTSSVVEVHEPHVTPPNPDETNAQNIPIAEEIEGNT